MKTINYKQSLQINILIPFRSYLEQKWVAQINEGMVDPFSTPEQNCCHNWTWRVWWQLFGSAAWNVFAMIPTELVLGKAFSKWDHSRVLGNMYLHFTHTLLATMKGYLHTLVKHIGYKIIQGVGDSLTQPNLKGVLPLATDSRPLVFRLLLWAAYVDGGKT